MYNGWKNYETWNVALWIENDEYLYSLARASSSYRQFLRKLEGTEGLDQQTPDGVSWKDSGLDETELDEMIAEL